MHALTAALAGGVGVEGRGSPGRAAASTQRAAAAIIAALSVHSSRGGHVDRDAQRAQRARAAAPLAATPPPMASRSGPVSLERALARATSSARRSRRW